MTSEKRDEWEPDVQTLPQYIQMKFGTAVEEGSTQVMDF